MKEFTYVIQDPVGIHARPAGMLAKEVKQLASAVSLTKGDRTANAASPMRVMALGVKCGDSVTVRVEGGDEAAASEAVRAFLEANF